VPHKYALVTTTINVPNNLEAYAKDIKERGDDAFIVVAGDKKTPREAWDFLGDIWKKYKVPVEAMPPSVQEAKYAAYSSFLGWNTIRRRNIALLHAYHQGADVIVTIDDDNHLTTPGYLKGHGELVEKCETQIISSESGWYNCCGHLVDDCASGGFYPRGYSMRERGARSPLLTRRVSSERSVVNAGLWIGDPDIDAVTRMAINPVVVGARNLPFDLGQGTYCPFNSQNTAIRRDAIPAYCMISGVGRYDDIVPSFFVKRISDHLGDYIRFGEPVVRQDRNAHDLWKDLESERVGMQMTDKLVDWLKGITLKGKTYGECLWEIIPALDSLWRADESLTPEQRGFMSNIQLSYQQWSRAL